MFSLGLYELEHKGEYLFRAKSLGEYATKLNGASRAAETQAQV